MKTNVIVSQKARLTNRAFSLVVARRARIKKAKSAKKARIGFSV